MVGCEGHRVDCELVHAEHMLDAVSNAFCSLILQSGYSGELCMRMRLSLVFIPCACACDQVQQGNAGEAHVEVPGSLPDEHGAFHDTGRGVQDHRVVPAPWPGGRSQENDVEGLHFTRWVMCCL